MKKRKGDSLKAQQDIAHFGKAARHPVCQAWLSLKRFQGFLLKIGRDAKLRLECLNDAKEIKKTAQGLVDRFYDEGKEKEAIEALAVMQKAGKNIPKLQASFGSLVNLFAEAMQEGFPILEARFERECDALALGPAAECEQALRALQTVKERWKNPKTLRDGQRLALEIMKVARDKAIKGAWAIGGAVEGYMEAAFGGDRPLTDEHWGGRFTARKLGDKEAKKVRRIAKRLGVRLADDQRGRKRKQPHLKRQQPKPRVGRPPNKMNPDMVTGPAPGRKAKHAATHDSFWRPSESDQQAMRDAKREISRLRRKLAEKQP